MYDTATSHSSRLSLPDVTLCAVSSSNLVATVEALKKCQSEIAFADALLFTHCDPARIGITDPDEIRVVAIDPLHSSQAYSHFILEELAHHVGTSHCLIVQWDGHVINADLWRSEFLDYDYIGASWPQFDDGHQVGNGGFSLRSRRLMQACSAKEFEQHHPEDVAIGRTNRAWLESRGMRFAPVELADSFSAERASDAASTFGYHGVFLMPQVLGANGFWEIYRSLDDRSTMRRDFGPLLKQMLREPGNIGRVIRMIWKRFVERVRDA